MTDDISVIHEAIPSSNTDLFTYLYIDLLIFLLSEDLFNQILNIGLYFWVSKTFEKQNYKIPLLYRFLLSSVFVLN